MMCALVLGGARSLWRDVDRARALGRFDIVVACNAAVRDWPGELHHAVTLHPQIMPLWLRQRRRARRPEPKHFWTVVGATVPLGLQMRAIENWQGSSGLLAAQVALRVADKAVLCGIPLDPGEEHFDKPGVWQDALNFRPAWERRARQMDGRIRSMGGWTAELLGRPTAAWLTAE